MESNQWFGTQVTHAISQAAPLLEREGSPPALLREVIAGRIHIGRNAGPDGGKIETSSLESGSRKFSPF